ncbi:hypothetical protein BD324DRAFT_649304 [Kockovaella imperatae]|uniref:tRNA-binding domain-containing protein n=1 Tax=Kockovaella imperatae TaxID=4999 RepID=A0A1Y1UME0_9TREE|nr:hypothetical protein BD324DRAFT_649304 [Kockovaella imperatae]ORX39220.1 hypothetical protein BD324DRAFT_649304 [Kockovaella imperatae]
MSVAEFVAAATKAEPSLAGENDKAKAEISKLESQTESMAADLKSLNDKLTPLTYLYENAPSSADVSLYCHLHQPISSNPEFSSIPSVLRYFLQIQSLPPTESAHKQFPNSFPPLDIDISKLPIPPRQVVEAVKKEKKPKADASAAASAQEGVFGAAVAAASSVAATAAAVVGSAVETVKSAAGVEDGNSKKKEKKEKKEKPAKVQPAKAEPLAPMPSMIDMRVGKVLDVKKHPDAESLYVEQIDVGEAEPRTVCSGLVKYMKEEQIQGATIIVICNLKPVTMRGVKSYAMLLCASSKDGKDEGGMEFVLPPEGSQPGERIYFEGEKYENEKPEEQLNPKKKIFETIQPGFTTLDTREAAWIDPETKSVHKIRTKDGVCRAPSLVGASLS